jgi:copper(I)-binding protein
MHPDPTRRALLRASLAVGAGLAWPMARGCEFFAPHLRVEHPWTRATAPGETVAGIDMKIDRVTRADRLIAVETPVAAGAELVGGNAGTSIDLPLPPGQETVLSEPGLFIRLTGLKHPLEIARSYPLQLTFEFGGVVNATLNVDYMRFG